MTPEPLIASLVSKLKHILLSSQESKELSEIQNLRHCDWAAEENTWPEHVTRLTKWTDAVRRKYKLAGSEPFTSA